MDLVPLADLALRLALLDEEGSMTVHTALRIGKAAESIDPRIVVGAARAALAMQGINGEDRTRAEALLATAAARSSPFL